MTIEQALDIRHLMNLRDSLLLQLDTFERCDDIRGNINTGANGLGFTWDKDSIQVRLLIEGIKQEISKIENTISRFQIKGGAE